MKIRFLQKQSYLSGFSPGILLRTIKGLPAFLGDMRRYRKMAPPPAFDIALANLFPILTDKSSGAGYTGDHYFQQDLWAARKVFALNPQRHFDVGSRIDGFIAHLLSFRAVTVMDIRPLQSTIKGLTFVCDDATEMPQTASDSIESLSSLHVAEHFGLGRYGDPIDPVACFKFMNSLQRVLAPGGRLLFSVPIGRERVEFNAHRVFAPETIIGAFSKLELVSFSYISDEGKLCEGQDLRAFPASIFACGLFEFTKSGSLESCK